MKPRRPQRQRQVASQEVLDSLLGLVQRKFYEGDFVGFQKDRKHLLEWVIFWPAEWLNERQVTVPNEQYERIVSGILIDAAAHQRAAKIQYRPAYLKHVLQTHFAMHGEEIYEAAKATRTLADHALMTLGKITPKEQDGVVAAFVAASRLLTVKKVSHKQPVKEQLTLL